MLERRRSAANRASQRRSVWAAYSIGDTMISLYVEALKKQMAVGRVIIDQASESVDPEIIKEATDYIDNIDYDNIKTDQDFCAIGDEIAEKLQRITESQEIAIKKEMIGINGEIERLKAQGLSAKQCFSFFKERADIARAFSGVHKEDFKSTVKTIKKYVEEAYGVSLKKKKNRKNKKRK